MTRKRASDYPPEVLSLFDGFVHGAISRRDFLDRVARYAVGGVTAAVLLSSLEPNFAWAEQVAATDKRIKTEAITYPSPQGSGHWPQSSGQPLQPSPAPHAPSPQVGDFSQ